jgi:hypothetical protein
MGDKNKTKSTQSQRAEREERLAAALRANLKRRKAQARGRADDSPSEANKTSDEERAGKGKS